MMKTTYRKRYLLYVVIIGLVLNSCRKDNLGSDTIAQDYATADAIFTEAHNISDEAEQSGTVSLKEDDFMGIAAGNCALITKDSTSTPGTKQIVIDFGSGCQGFDGRTRKGKVLVSYTGRYKDPGTVITIHFDGYSVNGNIVDNSSVKTVTNTTQTGGNLKWNVVVSGKVTLANGKGVVVWTANRMRELITGSSTPQFSDDVYLITGNSSGTTATNKSFTANITSPLRKDFSCTAGKRGFTAGSIDINVAGKMRILDFGNGTCDNEFTITVNGKTYTISL